MALSSTDPRVLMGQAKCFSCLSPKLQYQLRTYLLAKIAMGDTSITGVQALSVASTCFSCLTHGELLAAKQYLMAVWLGLDTTKTGIIAQAATAACDYACLTPVQAEQVRTYLLAVTAGVATDAAGVQALELAAKCFECPTNKRQLEMQVYLLSTLAPGAPTTASAIMQAAGCFLACVPPELHEALQTSLFAQVTSRSTPPCVTPTAPGQPSAFSALNNILKISWTQPANSGSLIQSYTLSYGTTQGGPYTASVTVQAGTKQAILNGLTAGTTYYFVVKANSFSGCSSANSAEGSAATTGTPPSNTLLQSLTHYWNLDNLGAGTYPDSLGTYAITASGGVAGNAGLIIRCFTGSAGALLFTGGGVDATWQFGVGVSLTMQFWWNPAAFGSGFAGQYDGTQAGSAWFLSADAGGNVTLQVFCSDATTKSVVIGTLNLNQWNQVIAGYDATNKIAFGSINAGARATVGTTADLNQNGVTNVGFVRAAAGGNGNGEIDEIGWWRGRVLTPTNVSVLFNGGAGLPFSSFQP